MAKIEEMKVPADAGAAKEVTINTEDYEERLH